MSKNGNPYRSLPEKAFWRRSVGGLAPGAVDPTGVFDLRIDASTRVATAGSCFAQHIARHLRASGYNYMVVEEGHPIIPPDVRSRNQYGTFSARYGNIYTARQLRQLVDRAYGRFAPQEDAWIEDDGRVLDPYRPTVQPSGFISVAEMQQDRKQHLAAVRRMFETLDVFVFTLGLTECWRSRVDGAVFPLCPGVEGGVFDPARHEFYNQAADEVIEDLEYVRRRLGEVNPRAQVVLTVSPVPLMATADPGAHVLSATVYSKSVLRVAAETMRRRYSNVHYFPSFEVITGSFNRGAYFGPDLRNVTEEGVKHVMGIFLKRATAGAVAAPAPVPRPQGKAAAGAVANAQLIVDVECDEAALDRR